MYFYKTVFFRITLYLLFLISFCAQPVIAEPPEGYQFQSLTKALQQSATEHKPMFLYFGRYGCTTCRKMHKEVFSDAGLRGQFSDEFILAYVDTESGKRIRLPNGERTTEMQFASRNRILGTPTFIYFSEDQKPIFKRAGFQTIEQMGDYNKYISEGHYKHIKLDKFLAAK